MTSIKPTLPEPRLKHDLTISVDLNPKISVGAGPWGQRNWISFTGGTWTAPWGNGTVEPGGQDSQIVLPDTLATRISTNYLLKTSDATPAYICITTSGWRTGPHEVLEALADPERADSVDPATYSFKLFVQMETGDRRYEGLNTGMWVGSGMRKGAQVVYDAYRVE